MSIQGNVLVIDDDESMRVGCAQTLTQQGFRVQAAENGQQGLEANGRESFDVVLLDLKMPGIRGMDVLQSLKKEAPGVAVIVITGYATIDSAVEAMKRGASDFLPKPFTPETLVSVVRKAVKARRRPLEDACVSAELDQQMLSEIVIGRSEAMERVFVLAKKAAPMDSTVLITGETGVGKEVVARAIHRMSRRREKPFVTVDCGTLVESLFESELFGHVAGAFSGAIETTEGKVELADGGTLFLDEIANINVNMQARLLRTVQEREICKVGGSEKIKVDVRIVSATNRDLLQEVRGGRFREDLFYRLKVVHIHVPPLRERVEDIPPLASFFLRRLAEEKGKKVTGISDEAMRFLKIHEWPGNVRELINALECAVVVCEGDTIEAKDLPYSKPERASGGDGPPAGRLVQSEREEISKALDQFNGNKTKAAQFLGINRKTLREKIRRYGIEV